MATFEELKLVQQSHQNFEGLRKDMRGNAQGYLDALSQGRSVAAVAEVFSRNTAEYLRRLNWAITAWNDLVIRAKIQNGLTAWSLQQSELTGFYTEMKTAADAEQAAVTAGLDTVLKIQTAANATLAAVAAHSSIWPGG